MKTLELEWSAPQREDHKQYTYTNKLNSAQSRNNYPNCKVTVVNKRSSSVSLNIVPNDQPLFNCEYEARF